MKIFEKIQKRIKPKHYKVAGLIIALPILIGVFFVSLVYLGVWGKIPSKNELSELQYQRASEVYSADSVLIGKFYLYDRQPIAYEELPDHLIAALISIEDERYYDHKGIDIKSLFRVGIKGLLLQDESSGGGSTLTQQLAKNRFPRHQRQNAPLVVNKIKEMIIARRLENNYSKDELLEHYLNTVPFGDNTFGIESASLKFFNKSANSLKIEEAAVLAGMLKATYSYNPRLFPQKSRGRRNLVLENMERNGFIEAVNTDSLKKLPLKIDYRDYDHNQGVAPYFREEVRKKLLAWQNNLDENLGINIYTSGLKIYTTLDYKMQLLAEEAMKEHMKSLQADFEKSYGKNAPWLRDENLLKKNAKRLSIYKKLKSEGLDDNEIWDSLSVKRDMTLANWNGEIEVRGSTMDSLAHYMKFLNTGSLSIDPYSGAVKTWIGGIDFAHFKYDHVSQSKRQVGSTFKPIVYTAALEMGVAPCDYFSAREVQYENLKDWSPSNSGEKDEAYLNYSLEEALSKSVNTVTVKVLEKTGLDNILEMGKKMGIEETLPHEPSIALGTGSIKITEMARAYSSYLNYGKPVDPYLISTITTTKDSVLQEFKPEIKGEPAFSEENRMLVLEMLKETVETGTAARLRSIYGLANAIAGKTGTTQNNKDAWFVGLMPKLVHVSWVGLENHEIGFKSTDLGQGANAALPLLARLLQKMNKEPDFNDITKAQFEPLPENIRELLDCEPVKRDGFFKRLFTNPDKKKKRKFKN